MKHVKTLAFWMFGIFISCFLTVLVLEIFFRFMPVATGFETQPVTFDAPVSHFKPNSRYIWSDEWNFAIVNRGRVNNAGFVNEQDYSLDDQRPLLAVIGDSYIHASMVPYPETLQGRLSQHSGQTHRIYSFAGDGAPLSQYLIWAQHAHKTYNPSHMIFVIISNDFDESLPRYSHTQVFHQFVKGEDGILHPALQREYIPDWKRQVLKSSALLRYLFFNLQIGQLKNRLQNKQNITYVDNVIADTSEQRIQDSKIAIDAFLNLVRDYSGVKKENILFIIDGGRSQIYHNTLDQTADQNSYFGQMRSYFIQQSRQKGFEVIDMIPAFQKHYDRHQKRFDFPTDAHWNGTGHGVVFEEAMKSKTIQTFFKSD